MALKSHALSFRSFFVLSFAINIVFVLRSFTQSSSRSTSTRFNHRAVTLEAQDLKVQSAQILPAAEEQTTGLNSDVPIGDASPEYPQPILDSTAKPLPSNGETVSEPPLRTIRTSEFLQQTSFVNQDESWTVFEDFTRRDGSIVFQSAKTKEQKAFAKTAEASFYQQSRFHPKYASVSMSEIGLAPNDILADLLLKRGEPSEEAVRRTIPPQGSKAKTYGTPNTYQAPVWTSFVGTVEASDNVAVYGYGNTRSYQPLHQAPEITSFTRTRFEGRLGGWMPAVRKVLTEGVDQDPPEDYFETIVFGDVDARDPFIVQTWHRTTHVMNKTIVKTVYGHSYPSFPRNKTDPPADHFYRALFRFGEYWSNRLSDMAHLTLPDQSWADMPKYAFAKELMVRPGGKYPKYGAIDRDYFGSEYDGFQDTFTSSLSANLEWGRFGHAWNVIDNYFTHFVGEDGSINMRGPEVGQFGLTLSLLSKYYRYSGEADLLWKHKAKIVATAKLLIGLHDESLKLPPSSPGYGLLHGWSESDSCLNVKPDTYWQPYFANSAMAARGLKDLSTVETVFREHVPEWRRRASQIANRTIDSIARSVSTQKKALYVPPLPGTQQTFREALAKDEGSPQAWTHRLYTELVHASILPYNLTNLVHKTMRGFGVTSMGVVANVAAPSRQGRDILGFISYGYAYSLLLADKTDEFILFMYTHRYHVHTRGAWNAGEVVDIVGGTASFCIPAQLTIPSIMRWALVLEDPDEDILYLGRGVPRAWLATGREVGIHQAPTRWGRVDYTVQYAKKGAGVDLGGAKIRAQLRFADRVPKEMHIKLRVPTGQNLTSVKVDGKNVEWKGESVVVYQILRQGRFVLIEGF